MYVVCDTLFLYNYTDTAPETKKQLNVSHMFS